METTIQRELRKSKESLDSAWSYYSSSEGQRRPEFEHLHEAVQLLSRAVEEIASRVEKSVSP